MAWVPVPNAIRVVLRADQAGSERINVLWVHGDNPVTSANVDAAVAAFHSWWTKNETKALFHQQVSYVSITGTAMDVASGGYEKVQSESGVTGTAGNLALPGGTAAVVSLKSSLSGRSGRGRVFMYGLNSADLSSDNGNLLTSAYVNAVQAAFFDLLGTLETAGLALAVCSRKLHVVNPVDTTVMDNKVDSQRRRLEGRGR